MKLFHRTNQGLHLTPAGQVIYRHAKYLFLIPGMPSRKPVPLPAFLKNVLYRKFASQSVQTFYGSVVQSKCFVSGLPAAHCSFWGRPSGHSYRNFLPGQKFDFLIGVCDSALWLDRCNFLPLGTYQHCISMSREHRLASKNACASKISMEKHLWW